MAYVRTVETASGATAVQIVWSSRRGARNIEHVGSAHDEAQVEALKTAAGERIRQGQGELNLGLNLAESGSGPLEIIGSRAGRLWDALCLAYEALGFHRAAGSDEVFRDLVLARIIEPTEHGWVGGWRGDAVAFRFQSPPVEPCVRFSRTRLTDALHRRCSISPARPGGAWVRRRCR